METIGVAISGTTLCIDKAVFTTLLDNSVAGTYVKYTHALDAGSIKFADLVYLARKGDIPYALFFAPLPHVEAQVAAKTKKLLDGIGKDTFSIGSRHTVRLRDVELIVKDLIRKQELVKKFDPTLVKNPVVGMLHRRGASEEDDADLLLSALGLERSAVWRRPTKEKALEFLIERLEANHILVARSVQHYMPQRLSHVDFSGMTIKDVKVPYIFLAGGDHHDYQEPVGRTIFTLALMTVLIARRVFKAVTWDGQSIATGLGREYDIAGSMLMPATRMRKLHPMSLDEIKAAADEFKVTPSAVTVRALRLGLMGVGPAQAHLDELREEYSKRPKEAPRNPIRPENAIRKYNGRELSLRMLEALDARQLSSKEFCRVVCLNKLRPGEIVDLRGVLQ